MTAPKVKWDPVIRVLHWSLVAMIAASFWLGHFGPVVMTWHFWVGYGVGGWLALRVIWGLIGPPEARLSALLRSPAEIRACAARLTDRAARPQRGHNPMGGLAIAVMLALLAAQVATGLLADDEVFSAGPLASWAGPEISLRATSLHSIIGWAVAGSVALHLAAIVFYAVWKRQNLVGPMLFGGRR